MGEPFTTSEVNHNAERSTTDRLVDSCSKRLLPRADPSPPPIDGWAVGEVPAPLDELRLLGCQSQCSSAAEHPAGTRDQRDLPENRAISDLRSG